MNDPICGRCLHIRGEHHEGACLPTLPGGAVCDCRRFVELSLYTAEQLRIEANELLNRAAAIDKAALFR